MNDVPERPINPPEETPEFNVDYIEQVISEWGVEKITDTIMRFAKPLIGIAVHRDKGAKWLAGIVNDTDVNGFMEVLDYDGISSLDEEERLMVSSQLTVLWYEILKQYNEDYLRRG